MLASTEVGGKTPLNDLEYAVARQHKLETSSCALGSNVGKLTGFDSYLLLTREYPCPGNGEYCFPQWP